MVRAGAGDSASAPSPLPPPPLPPPHPSPRLSQGGPLLVTPVASTMVATDAMHAHLERLSALEHQLAGVLRPLAALDAAGGWHRDPTVPAAGRRSVVELAAALQAARAAHRTADHLLSSLRRAIVAYDAADDAAHARADAVTAASGAQIGSLLRIAAPGLTLLALVAAAGALTPDPGGFRRSAVRRFFLQNPQLITGPRFVQAVRQVTSGLDEGISAFAGIPAPIAVALGAAGVTGVRTSARHLVAAGPGVGLLRESPVTISRVATGTVAAPAVGAVQRLERVPEVDQVRIERYDAPGRPSRYVVYLGPTETFSPKAATEPWDLTSNVGGVGGLDVGAYRASELAMHDAGIASDTPVQFVGFSQGGLLAAMLASSGDWNAAGIQTFGAPSGDIAMPEGLSGMAVRNTDDFIPMLGGPQLDHHLLQVERRAYEQGQPLPTDEAAPAHERDAYMTTAAAVDRAASEAVRRQTAALDAFTTDYTEQPGSSITGFSYRAQRVEGEPIPSMREVTRPVR